MVDSLSLEGALRVIAAPGTFIRVKASTLSKDCEGVTNEGHVLKVINEEDVPSGHVKATDKLLWHEAIVYRHHVGHTVTCVHHDAREKALPRHHNTDQTG